MNNLKKKYPPWQLASWDWYTILTADRSAGADSQSQLHVNLSGDIKLQVYYTGPGAHAILTADDRAEDVIRNPVSGHFLITGPERKLK